MNLFTYIACSVVLGWSIAGLPEPCKMTVKIATPPIMKTPSTITAITIIGGGTAPYNYAWGNGATSTECLLPNAAQTITVTVTDNAGCIARDTLVVP